MKQRIITALAVLAILVPLLWYGNFLFDLAVLFLAGVAYIEIMQMANIRLISAETILGLVATVGLALPLSYYEGLRLTPILLLCICSFLLLISMVFSKNEFSFEKAGLVALGALYVGLGSHYVIATRSLGFGPMLFVLAIFWFTDSGAFFVGKAIGKRKLAPDISPNKSVEGAVGGVVIAALLALVVYLIAPPFTNLNLLETLFLTVAVSISGQLGDLVESAIKRFYNVKDSGSMLPGHGGVLDRFDSTLFGVVACHIVLLFFK